VTDHSWRDDAACLEQFTDMWFPDRGHWTDANTMAVSVCRECPVRAMCLEAALDDPEQIGIRGALTGQQRSKLLRRTA
jgi:hypothetical protein